MSDLTLVFGSKQNSEVMQICNLLESYRIIFELVPSHAFPPQLTFHGSRYLGLESIERNIAKIGIRNGRL